MIIGILGGGQLGMMLCQVASKLNIQTFIYSDTDDSPAIKYANHFLIKKYDDFHEIDNFINKCDFVTYEFENIPFKTLSYIEQKIKISPSSEINQIIQDRLTEKNYVNKINIPTVPYMEINNTSDLKSVDPKFFPAILKTRKLGYDGKGQIVIVIKIYLTYQIMSIFWKKKLIYNKKSLSLLSGIKMVLFLPINQLKIFIKIKFFSNHFHQLTQRNRSLKKRQTMLIILQKK